jgi:methionyl-tRNA synthetase
MSMSANSAAAGFGHGFMTFRGQRMSKSLGTPSIRSSGGPFRRRSAPPVSHEGDAFGGDGDFTWERYDDRYNTDLANNLATRQPSGDDGPQV